ncbi:MAG: AAA family ATPase [Crenarchaeota archaeon]|nr:AAA family ATPase [Thermoproteota archaeon]
MVFCRQVRVLSNKPITRLPYYRVIRVGRSFPGYGDTKVSYTYPHGECVLGPCTEVMVEEYITYNIDESLEHNIVLELRFASGTREYYVYPKKVWRKIYSKFVKPLSNGEPPREAGTILFGPPGTGKTSMARILAWLHGLHTVYIDPQNILSKYVGESEQRLHKYLGLAEAYEPSLVLFDDAEWLVRSRQSIQGGEDVGTYLGMMNILLRRIERWSRAKRMIVNIITTNVGEEKIDPALKRSGRLARPIFVPLPDYEAVYTLLTRMGVDKEKAEKYAIKIVNAGLPMSDAASIARDLLAGETPEIEPVKARGYIRLVPPTISTLEKKYLEKHRLVCHVLNQGTRIWVNLEAEIGVPLVAALVGVICKKPLVILHDQRRFDEAASTASLSGAVLVITHDYISRDVVRLLNQITSAPIIFVGTTTPPVPSAIYPRLAEDLGGIENREPIFRIVADYYNIKYRSEDIHDIKHMARDAFSVMLRAMSVVRGHIKHVRRFTRVV